MLIVGERINSSRKEILEAMKAKDARLIQDEAKKQLNCGAGVLDINSAMSLEREAEDIEWLVNVIQKAVGVPLCIDSPNPEVIKKALSVHKGKALVNSVTGEKKRINEIMPLVKQYHASVIALTMDEDGMPDTATGRLDIAKHILETLLNYGIEQEDIYFDPLVRPISTEANQAKEFLCALRLIKKELAGVKTICGLSNVSFGLPKRGLLNATFLAMALDCGLDAAIIDPTDKMVRASLKASQALLGEDNYCLNYISAARKGELNLSCTSGVQVG